MRDNRDKLREAFREEAREILSGLETLLLQLERAPADMEIVSSVFRSFHTLKGSGAMMGFEEVSLFTHEIENVYDLVRNGTLSVDRRLIGLTLSSCDVIGRMIESAGQAGAGKGGEARALISSLHTICPQLSSAKQPGIIAPAGLNPFQDETGTPATYRIRFRPDKDIFLGGINPLLILKELRDLGECTVLAHMEGIPALDELDPEACYTFWDIILTTRRCTDAVRDAFIFVEDQCDLTIEVIDSELLPAGAGHDRLGEILVGRKDLGSAELRELLECGRVSGEFLINEGLVRPENIRAALAEQQHVRKIRQKRKEEQTISSIRVPSAKLDKLVNLVGELVTVQARLSRLSGMRRDPALASIGEELERLTADIRDRTMDMRMVPIGTLFGRFGRLVRDLSTDLGKEVDLLTEGAETELDKTIVEKLNDPLVHLIRNCVDHAIEAPAIREHAGKKRAGAIRLSALHSGDYVRIEISDDGAGLDAEAIGAKALEKGLISPDGGFTEEEIFPLIFLPGFSTASHVTSISGRGVGMDVVKKTIESLRGTIGIDSTRGHGTRITLTLPLTMAIIDGLLVKTGEEMFVFPLSMVEECVELVSRDDSREPSAIANVRGRIIPYVRLRRHFGIDGEPPAIEQIVIIKSDGQHFGLVVDKVIGGHQTVIKSLGKVFREIDGISGATILGDGSVALILDIPGIMKIAEKEVG